MSMRANGLGGALQTIASKGFNPGRNWAPGYLDKVAEAALDLIGGDLAVVRMDDATGIAGQDVSHHPAAALADHAMALRYGYVSQAVVQLRFEGRCVGTLAVLNRSGRSFDSREVAALQLLASGFAPEAQPVGRRLN